MSTVTGEATAGEGLARKKDAGIFLTKVLAIMRLCLEINRVTGRQEE
jgi:hypothetical protein